MNIINTLLYQSTVDNHLTHSNVPNLKVKDARLKGWKTSNRNSLNVLSYATQFIKATKVLLNDITEIAFKSQVGLADFNQ